MVPNQRQCLQGSHNNGRPEAILQQRVSAVGSRVASAQRCVQRLNERSASCSGDVLQTRQVARRSGVETLEGGVRLGISLAGTEDNFLWNDEFWYLTDLFWGMEMGEGIRSHILGTWTIGDRDIEAGEK